VWTRDCGGEMLGAGGRERRHAESESQARTIGPIGTVGGYPGAILRLRLAVPPVAGDFACGFANGTFYVRVAATANIAPEAAVKEQLVQVCRTNFRIRPQKLDGFGNPSYI
jgi:hypothetical protein